MFNHFYPENNYFENLIVQISNIFRGKIIEIFYLSRFEFSNSERSEECIDFTMIITSRNNAPISKFWGGFRCKSEYPWCIIEKIFQQFSRKLRKPKKKKMTEKREFLRKTNH
ncbi:Uncharacterized protein FWK35_00000044 [Aphis craccivora]|uniref:Uncharacterized protein n=1 Tax=Aphis craccivora TaxID=307492 RepID=A0A6G0ZQD9_APHCR|nr:Uncharacterized protein FWK35_00000044 [Aphis craccivora]